MKITDFPAYKENPIINSYKEGAKLDKVTNLPNSIILFNETTKEKINASLVIAKEKPFDKTEFTKIYNHDIDFMIEFNKSAMRVFAYITKYAVRFNDDKVYLYNEDYMEKYDRKTKDEFYDGIVALLNLKVIFRSHNPYEYFININHFFRGERRFLLF